MDVMDMFNITALVQASASADRAGYGAAVALFAARLYETAYNALPSYESILMFAMRNPRLVTYAVSASAAFGLLLTVITVVSYFLRCLDRLRCVVSFFVCFPLWYWPMSLLYRGLVAVFVACCCGCCGCRCGRRRRRGGVGGGDHRKLDGHTRRRRKDQTQ